MFKLLKKLFLLGLVLAAVFSGGFYWFVSQPLQLKGERVEFEIAPGQGLRSAAREIARAGIDVEPWVLVVLGKLLRADASLKVGSYEITRGVTARTLLDKLTRGDVTQSEVVLPEGWTLRQLRERIDANADLRHETRGLADVDLLRRLGAPEMALEGLFFPDTYLFAKQSRDFDVLARAYQAMRRHLAREWETRDAGLPYADPYQALIMASIVEKETGRDADRPLVAAVFVNRLRKGMPLQTDPTVIYGLGERFDGNLRKRDLQTDSPYNTYLRSGLPPTPIAMPGMASLRAALHPANSEALYFVAKGDGGSHFSQTLDEHNRAVNRYQRRGR